VSPAIPQLLPSTSEYHLSPQGHWSKRVKVANPSSPSESGAPSIRAYGCSKCSNRSSGEDDRRVPAPAPRAPTGVVDEGDGDEDGEDREDMDDEGPRLRLDAELCNRGEQKAKGKRCGS